MKRFFALLTALGLMCCTGCTASGRVNDKYYLRAVTISGNDGISLDMDFFAEGAAVRGAEGDDIAAAKSQAELMCGRTIFTGYTELIVLSGCEPLGALEVMLRSWKVSPRCLVVYSSEPLGEDASSEQLTGVVREAVGQGRAPECDMMTVLSGLLHGGAVVPEVTDEGFAGTVTLRAEEKERS